MNGQNTKSNSIPENISELVDDYNLFESYSKVNTLVDDNESELEVFLRKGDDELLLSKPSLALFHGDRSLYTQEVTAIKDAETARVLNIEEFPRNRGTFFELAETIRSGLVIPFIGAGFSIGAGCPSWQDFLQNLVAERNLDEATVQALFDTNDYEKLMSYILEVSRPGEFEQYFEQDFIHEDVALSPCSVLPKLFNNCVITTNFDRVIEECYQLDGVPFEHTAVGLNDAFTFLKAIPKGRRCLLKLHGNMNNANYRVLSFEEYEQAYGDNRRISFSNPLPELLQRVYLSYSLLFLGCSLQIDRTIETFIKIVREQGAAKVPEHFALIEAPTDPDQLEQLRSILIEANIKPIWFPEGEYDLVSDIISLLVV